MELFELPFERDENKERIALYWYNVELHDKIDSPLE